MSFLSIKDNILALVAKLEEISNIPHCYEVGEDFVGLIIGEGGIFYKTCTYYSSDTDSYDFFVSWEDIDKPIEYFKEKYLNEYIEREAEKKRILDAKKIADEEKEKKEYERLKKIWG